MASAHPQEISHGIVLFAHGSRDPQWRAPIERIATLIQELSPKAQVRCAYLEMATPDLPSAVDELAQLGLRSLLVLPIFLGVGKHLRQDLPELIETLRRKHPQIVLQVAAAVGENEEVLRAIARSALRVPDPSDGLGAH